MITSLGEEGAGLCASRAFVCLFVLYVLVFVIFLFLLVLGVASVCDCGTPWTFLLTFWYVAARDQTRDLPFSKSTTHA